ncbi:MAG: DUF2167 domain-containing protein [Aquabacterium sp.]|uniref:DUF2167 domain-containing protein n=1 Tax=Aquabacterium sp. TaxID=1872578 RepID=UPI00122368F0|nr:DUF2167 domain-containing protein [Aquabacterium sp.]TAK97230.1 MAG: DUF2167 domain-containing protein [Aquabacterium sp.]
MIALAACHAPAALADEAPATSTQEQAHQAAFEQATKAMQAAQVKGPAEIKLRDQATLKLPAGYVWVPEPAAGQFMKAVGNHPDERELGLIFPASEAQGWMVVARYEDAGYIKDDDAKNWNVDDLFKSLKDGTEASNEERRKNGYPELDILGWVEKPNYVADTHRLVWSMSARVKGAPADEPTSINYNTYALGREGYITLNLITGQQAIGQDKVHAQTLLSALDFNEGKRYADFNQSTDKVAEYGLAALVGGLAAKKLGMFALAAGFFAKFAKIILLAGAGVMAAVGKFFKRDKNQG